MSDQIQINNTCPDITLWQQYRKNEPSVNYFNWLKTYWQTKYFTPLITTFLPALSLCNNNSEYVQFFARYWYGIIRPIDVTAALRWDEGLIYDTGAVYDYRTDAGPIALEMFRRLLEFILDWTEHDWNLTLLYKMIHGFTGTAWADILIEQDDTRLDVFLITMPTSTNSSLFKSLIQNYTDLWRLPFGIDLEITLT